MKFKRRGESKKSVYRSSLKAWLRSEKIKRTLLVIAAFLLIAVAGTRLIFDTHAATMNSAAESEAGVISGNATVTSDANASHGQAVRFGSSTTLYVQPGTQGYRGLQSALVVYSEANGKLPPGDDCAWDHTYKYMRCNDTNLSLDHVYIQGGLYWAGCGNLKLTNSIFDWQPQTAWFDVFAACTTPQAGSIITATGDTFETGSSVPTYTGGSDIGGLWENTGEVPLQVSNSLFQGFPQGLDPGPDSIIKNNEIYTSDATCGSSDCHVDGLFSQGGDNILYQGNYIDNRATGATAAIFYQSDPHSTGNQVIGNFLQGGAYNLYNEDSDGLVVENNTFGTYIYGHVELCSGSWGTWSGNVNTNGAAINAPVSDCTH